jgi:ParB family chromosome partitioning protein
MAKAVKRPALGQGLGALLRDTEPVAPRGESPARQPDEEPALSIGAEIPIDNIEPNPHQPRRDFNEEALRELADSIKNLGVIQPITVHVIRNGKFQIISGERRYRAARMAGLETIPAFIRTVDDEEKSILIQALVENIQRENLNALEIAVTYQRLMDEGSLTQDDLSRRIGKKRSTVANYLRLLQQPAEVQAAVRTSAISMGHARAIAGLQDDKDQVRLVRMAIDKALSVRQVEDIVKKAAQPKPPKTTAADAAPDPTEGALKEAMKRCFNVNITLRRNEKGNSILTIPFGSDEEINEFLTALNLRNPRETT